MDTAYLFGQVFGAFLGSFIGAIFVRLATRMVAGFTPRYGNALGACLLGTLAAFLFGLVFGFIIGYMGEEITPVLQVIIILPCFAMQVVVYKFTIKDPETDEAELSYWQALLVSLAQIVLALLMIGGAVLVVILAAHFLST